MHGVFAFFAAQTLGNCSAGFFKDPTIATDGSATTDVCTGLCLVLAPLFVGHFGLVRVVWAGKLRAQVENFGAGGNLLSYQHIRRRGYFNSMEISSISILVFSCKHKFSFQFLSL